MGGLADGLDTATKDMCTAAGIMVATADVFPDAIPLGKLMGLPVGGPGSLIEGSQNWLQGAGSLQAAQQGLTELCGSLTFDQWSGDDRAAFDATVSQLAAQLGDAHNMAQMVGAILAGQSVPLLAYGPVALSIGGVLLSLAIAFEAAAASVVGDVVGASESLYAAGCAAAGVSLGIVAGFVAAVSALMEAGAAALEIGGIVDRNEQAGHGDTTAYSDYKQAQVAGLKEAGENLESWGVGLAADAAGDKATEGLPTASVADKAVAAALGGKVSEQIQNDNAGVTDIVNGEDPLTTLTDTLGVTPQVHLAEDAADGVIDLPDDIASIINEGINWKQH